MSDRAHLPQQPQGRSVFEARNKRWKAPRLSDGKDHPVVVKRVDEDPGVVEKAKGGVSQCPCS